MVLFVQHTEEMLKLIVATEQWPVGVLATLSPLAVSHDCEHALAHFCHMVEKCLDLAKPSILQMGILMPRVGKAGANWLQLEIICTPLVHCMAPDF